jgi:hypothetical protein
MHGIGESTDPARALSACIGARRLEARVRFQGFTPMSRQSFRAMLDSMSRYVLEHRHEPRECGVVFNAFKGHESPLRHRPTLASCRSGGHAIWWTVEAETEAEALGLLPGYVADRTTVSRVNEVEIP